jgi:hypothetical protein
MINGKIEKKQIIEALNNPTIKVDFGLAPSEPLFLTDILYDFNFMIDKRMLDFVKDLEKKIILSF